MEIRVIRKQQSYELYHYGVKGMRWGVRKYQNKDGTLTDAGRLHYDYLRKTSEKRYVLPANTTIYRAVANGSKKFMERDYTYTSVTDKYYEHLYETEDGFEGRFDADYVMKTKKPLKIASSEDYFNAVMIANNIDPKTYLDKVPKSVIEKGRYAINNDLLEHKLVEGDGGKYPALNNAVKYLKENGFDGVIDPQDGSVDERRQGVPRATIIFNPKDNLEIVDEKKRDWVVR